MNEENLKGIGATIVGGLAAENVGMVLPDDVKHNPNIDYYTGGGAAVLGGALSLLSQNELVQGVGIGMIVSGINRLVNKAMDAMPKKTEKAVNGLNCYNSGLGYADEIEQAVYDSQFSTDNMNYNNENKNLFY